MPGKTIVGIFESPRAAEQAKEKLLEAGVGRHRIRSGPLVGKVPDPALYGGDERGGVCVLEVAARSEQDKRHIAVLLRRVGARATEE